MSDIDDLLWRMEFSNTIIYIFFLLFQYSDMELAAHIAAIIIASNSQSAQPFLSAASGMYLLWRKYVSSDLLL